MLTPAEILEAKVTLDGKPAKIVGLNNEFPKVVDAKTGLGYEWSYPTICRVIAKGGKFKS